MQRRQVTAIAGSIATGMAALAGCTASEDPDDSASGGADDTPTDEPADDSTPAEDSTPTQTPTEEPKDVTILDHELVESIGLAVVEGTLKNTSGRELSYIQVDAYFYDEEGTRLGQGLDNASDVPADQELTFEALSDVEFAKVDSYDVEVGTGL